MHMNAYPSHSERYLAATRPVPTFRCVVIHEDFSAGMRGKHFYETLTATMDSDCVSTHNRWSFSTLAIAEMRNLAVSAAAAADIVIFALSGREKLPVAVKEWIEMWIWLIENTQPALVALFDGPNDESGSIRAYLRAVTASKHLDFYPDGASMPAPASLARSRGRIGRTPFAQRTWADEEVAGFATV